MFKSTSFTVNFPQMEKDLLTLWEKEGIVDKYLHKNDRSNKKFSFIDGPITANNPMGVHHAWGRTYKDLWQRFYNMKGYSQRFQNGFDCQGLWVEVEVEKELGIKNKRDIENLVPGNKKKSIARFVKLCKERVLKYSRIQAKQSQRLGYFMDWDNSYYTMSDENNYMIWHYLKKCHQNGWIYNGYDSVPWCPRCQTAISQHEMLTEDYKELTHDTVFVKLPITSPTFKNTSLLIWTTTPWTVSANVAVGVNKKFTYGIWVDEKSKEKIIFISRDEEGNIPTRLIKRREVPVAQYIFQATGQTGYKKIKELPAEDLIGLKYDAPFDFLLRVKDAQKDNPKTFHTVVDASEIVVASEGTGLLHVAPGAGKEDFDLGKEENLPVISVIGDDARYLDGMGEFSGQNAKAHPEIIIDFLKNRDQGKYLLGTMRFTHRYPACWRCKTELVWKVAREWYIAMDKKEKKSSRKKSSDTLRQSMIKVAKMIDWRPAFGLDRELDWLSNMSDWLISKKNRYWGLALPIFECQSCGWFDVIGSKEELKERVVAGWDKFEGHSPHKPYIDEVKIKCDKCQKPTSRIDDVGNVWLDAGIVPFSTYVDPKSGKLSYTTDKKYWRYWFPADFITESFPGQFKNWFYSMIAMATVLEKKNPFKTVLGFASVLGEDGRPMHKSWGNAVDFNEGANSIGVDVMRWMFLLQDPEQNILFGLKKADETRKRFHLMLWNIYNFFITYANIDQWTIKSAKMTTIKNILDKWILSELTQTIITVDELLSHFYPSKAAQAIEDFVLDLSQWYVRRSRSRVGPTSTDSDDRQSCYQTLYHILIQLSQILAPFNPFISDAIFRNLSFGESVHLSQWPKTEPNMIDNDIRKQMVMAREIVEKGHAQRKAKGIKVRIPMGKLEIKLLTAVPHLRNDIWELILDELNVKNITINKKINYPKKSVVFSQTMLEREGQAREIIRTIQLMRKTEKYKLTDDIIAYLPSWPSEFEQYIKKHTLSISLKKNTKLRIEKA